MLNACDTKLEDLNEVLSKVQPRTEAVSYYRSAENGKIIYILTCAICSEDSELFPLGSIKGYKSNLVKGQKSCGCSTAYRWKEKQVKVRIERKLRGGSVSFHGWVGGTFKGVRTYLKLEDTSLGVCWVSSTVANFLRQGSNPPSSVKVKKEGRIDKLFQKFCDKVSDSSRYKPDYKNVRYVYYNCPICKEDELVKSGLCTGIFKVLKSTASRGSKPCRCSSSYIFTKSQREFLVKKKLNEKGGTFIRWENEDLFTWKDFVQWRCKEGHQCSTIVNAIMRGRGCGTCFKKDSGMYGFYRSRKEDIDTLYVIDFNNEYIKVGRTFNLENRLKSLSRQAGIPVSQLTVLTSYKDTHLQIFDLEQEIHSELRERGFTEYKVTWSRELFTSDSYSCITYLLGKFIYDTLT